MSRQAVLLLCLLAACGGGSDPPAPVYGDIYDGIDGDRLIQTLKELSGVVPVTVNGNTFSIDQRYDDVGRQHFLDYWRATMEGMGLTVRSIDVPAGVGPRAGEDLEAVLPGQSPDSIVVIVHYDSIGPPGDETNNPGVDDDMTGMAVLIETARVLVPYQAQLQHTVRFVAADEEELGGLAGARAYAQQIEQESLDGGWKIVAAVDDEQTGWNCHTDGICAGPWPTFDVFTCDGAQFDYPELGDQLESIVHYFQPDMQIERGCIGANSDHYAMWEIGVPAIVYTEHDPFDNPHFDQRGGDTFDKIDQAYFLSIARPAITFQAQLIGIQ